MLKHRTQTGLWTKSALYVFCIGVRHGISFKCVDFKAEKMSQRGIVLI